MNEPFLALSIQAIAVVSEWSASISLWTISSSATQKDDIIDILSLEREGKYCIALSMQPFRNKKSRMRSEWSVGNSDAKIESRVFSSFSSIFRSLCSYMIGSGQILHSQVGLIAFRASRRFRNFWREFFEWRTIPFPYPFDAIVSVLYTFHIGSTVIS